MLKAFLALCAAMLACGIGNLMLRKGMIEMGPLDTYQIGPLFRYFAAAVTNPWVIGGILIEIVYFFLWLAVLSWADVSWALPMNAVEYILVAVLALFFLGEKVDWTRWVGIFFIMMGVVFMSASWNEQPTTEALDNSAPVKLEQATN
ncbi:MAG: EamA family transporter [Deltaproteobacteria bacterium]|nr:EamA family transporter [Deltaproteobacteria bacterium]